jgi:hypothetical protein
MVVQAVVAVVDSQLKSTVSRHLIFCDSFGFPLCSILLLMRAIGVVAHGGCPWRETNLWSQMAHATAIPSVEGAQGMIDREPSRSHVEKSVSSGAQPEAAFQGEARSLRMRVNHRSRIAAVPRCSQRGSKSPATHVGPTPANRCAMASMAQTPPSLGECSAYSTRASKRDMNFESSGAEHPNA